MNAQNSMESPQSEPPVVPIMLCNSCGAVLSAVPRADGKSRCWMCGQNPSARLVPASHDRDTLPHAINPYAATAGDVIDPQSVYLTQQALPPLPRNRAYDGIFTILLFLCVGLASFVGIGLGAQEPGMLIPYLVLVLPAFCVTGVRGLWQYSSKGEANPKSMFLSLIVSFAVTICILVLLAAAGVVLLMLMCLNHLGR